MILLILCVCLFIIGITISSIQMPQQMKVREEYLKSRREVEDKKGLHGRTEYEIRESAPNIPARKWQLLAFLAVAVLLVVGWQMYFNNINTKAYLESFYENNAQQYQIATDKTASYLSQDKFTQQLIAGNVEKAQLATSISDRIADWRNSVVGYNQTLKTYRIWKSNIWVGIFMPQLPDDIKPLEIK